MLQTLHSNTNEKRNTTSRCIRDAISDKCKRFCQHCTIHGVFYFYSSLHWWVHLTWCCILAASLALCVFLGHMIWSKFIVDPTFTIVESTRYPTEKIPFPAVSICDTEVIYGPNTENITRILQLRGFDHPQIEEFYRSFSEIKHKEYKPAAFVKKMHVILEALGYSYDLLLDQLKKPCDVLLKQCVWRSKVNDCSDMFRQVFTVVGYCCQFDIHHFRRRAKKNTNFIAGIEVTEALDVTVDCRRYVGNSNVNDGYALLYVFDEHDALTPLDGSITITPGTFSDVMIGVWIIDSSNDVQTLSIQNRKCILENEHDVYSRSYQDCMTKLIMKKVVETCRCLPFRYTYDDLDVEEMPPCPWLQLSCIYQTLERVQGDIRNLISEEECYERCDYVQYETEAEFLKQGRDLGNQSLYSRVSVHFSDDTCMKYRREVLYTWDQMLANLGGIFGLCLGGSIISIIEMIWFVLELLYTIAAILYKKMTSKGKMEKNALKMKKKNFTSSKILPVTHGSTGQYPFIN